MTKPWLKYYDPHVPQKLEYPNLLLPRILDEAADRFPEKMAVFFFGGKIPYGALRAHANQFAHALMATGFRPGDRLGILLPNMPQAMISAFGAWKAGGMAVFFDPLLEADELKRQFNETGIEAIVVFDLVLRRIDPVFYQTKLKHFIIAGVKDYLPFPRGLLFSLAARGRGLHVKIARKPNVHLFKEFLLSGRSDQPGKETGSPQDPAVIEYTRGTTGPPKGVLLTHKTLMANVLQAAAWMGMGEKGKEGFLSIVPFHEAYGLTMAMNLPVYLGAFSVHQPQFETHPVLTLVKKLQPSFFPASPKMIEYLATYLHLEKYPVSKIKAIWSMGNPVEEDAFGNLERRIGRKIVEGYGLTEASPLTHANPVHGTRKAGSIGIPLPDTDARIVDPQDGEKEMPVGESGELAVQGPQVMKGYWKKEEETARALRKGWLHTGDLARMDEDGFFYLLGRIGKKKEDK